MARVQVPVLGRRGFYLGMPYNLCTDIPFTGKQLFKKALQSVKKTSKMSEPTCIITEENRQELYKCLYIDDHCKLSILGDVIGVQGAAECVNYRKSSENEVQVVLRYGYTLHSEELKTEKLKRGDHTDVLRNVDATHFVSGLLYGCDIFIVFTRSVATGETYEEVKDIVYRNALAIQSMLLRPSSYSPPPRSDTNKITCKYFGDVETPFQLNTYSEVANACGELSDLVKKNLVPKLATLNPLPDRSCRQLVQEVSTSLTNSVEQILEQLVDVNVKCKDMWKKGISETFPHLRSNMIALNQLASQLKSWFVSELSRLVPEARRGGNAQRDLELFVKGIQGSPLNYKEYIRLKGREATLLESCVEKLVGHNVQELSRRTECGLQNFIHREGHSCVFCFHFNVDQGQSPFLCMLEKKNTGSEVVPSDQPKEWVECEDIVAALQKHINSFLDFVAANKDKEETGFAFSSKSEASRSNPEVTFYINGQHTLFTTPVAPTVSQYESGATSVDLSWTIPEPCSERPRSYRVYYRPSSTSQSQEWSREESSRTRIKIKNLHENTEYVFAVESVYPHYISPRSPEVTTTTIPTKSTSYCTLC